jgi:hypothetical protein
LVESVEPALLTCNTRDIADIDKGRYGKDEEQEVLARITNAAKGWTCAPSCDTPGQLLGRPFGSIWDDFGLGWASWSLIVDCATVVGALILIRSVSSCNVGVDMGLVM